MWQRFTERARRIIFFAQEEAGRFGEHHVCTEHLLLGMLRENDHVAAKIITGLGVSLEQIREEIQRQVVYSEQRVGPDMQLAPRSQRVVELAYDEARDLNNNYIGTEHLLLGLLREAEGLAGRVLLKLGLELEPVRSELRRLQEKMRAQGQHGEAKTAPPEVLFVKGILEITGGEWYGVLREINSPTSGKEVFVSQAQIQCFGLKTDDFITGQARAPQGQEKYIELLRVETVNGKEARRQDSPQKGDLGVLRNPDHRQQVEVAAEKEALAELAEVMATKDHHGYHDLLSRGRIDILPAGTEVKVLRVEDAAGHQVRVLQGEQEGQVRWVSRSQFQWTGPDTRPFPPPLPGPADTPATGNTA